VSSVQEEKQGLLGIVDAIGRFPREAFSTWWDIIGMISIALTASKDIFKPSQRPIFWELFKDQLYETGVRAVYINGMIAMFIGALMMARLFAYFPKQVLSTQYAYLFVVVVVRELGPLISGIILIARSATAVTSKIGNLRVRREFQVLHGMGINPVFLYLVPVFFAFPISLCLMLIYFDFICILSAFAVIWYSDPDVSFLPFLSSILEQISLNEIGINAVKAILGGMLIGVISIHFGAKATDSFEDISEAISNSTTTQLMAFFLLNVVLSLLAYTQ
jgi:phospholipid/cholesterol/gamma-HCH transport system permease protein|tara:strand:+ start:1968 stop:2795 length:828 start_codon:yes stop_codon:yes gene_type:complete